MTLVKICGISEPEHARAAANSGADFVGIVFAPSHRQVTIGQAKAIASVIGPGGQLLTVGSAADVEAVLSQRRPLLVGVFADQDIDTINAIAAECRLDLVQLSGNERQEICIQIDRPVLKCRKVKDGEKAEDVIKSLREGTMTILDPYVDGAYGGTGRLIDWAVAADVAAQLPVILAGGLTPRNVKEAIWAVHPWAVDVSSGVETDGVKDAVKIQAFLQEAKRAVSLGEESEVRHDRNSAG